MYMFACIEQESVESEDIHLLDRRKKREIIVGITSAFVQLLRTPASISHSFVISGISQSLFT